MIQHNFIYIFFVFCTGLSPATTAQVFKIGSIDIYGNRKTDAGIIYKNLDVKEDDSVRVGNFKTEDVVAKLTQIPGVRYASVNPVCCDPSGNLLIYIGIGESDSVIIKHRDAPTQNIKLPAEMVDTYNSFKNEVQQAVEKGEAAEVDTSGYALFTYLPARNLQKSFLQYASQNVQLLASILRNSEYTEQRAAAAEIIAYSTDRKFVADNLLFAVDDPDDEVRNNATRALGILVGYARAHPGLKLNIPAAPFIRMMNSIVWTDRNKGASVLTQLSESRNAKILNEIKQKALPSIIEMAKWKDRAHAFFAFIILGRISGEDEKLLVEKNFSDNYIAEVNAMIDKIANKKRM